MEEARVNVDSHIRKVDMPTENKEPFGPWMMVSRTSRRFDKPKEIRVQNMVNKITAWDLTPIMAKHKEQPRPDSVC